MKQAVIVAAARTPIGRAHPEKGVYRDVRSDDLAVAVVRAVVERAGIQPELVEDLILGCAKQQGEQGLNVARLVGLMAGLGSHVPGTTVNRLCGSGLQALAQASHAIAAGAEDIQIVGGLEHMHHLPMESDLDVHPRLFAETSRGALMMGVTAEFLAQTHGISRRDQDDFALQSHRRADAAATSGSFAREIVPVWGRDPDGNRALIDRDQSLRSDTSAEALAGLSPVFMPKLGTITAGNSSPLSDGAAALLVMSAERAQELGLRPLARVVATAVVGVEPCTMGLGPVPATQKVLARAGMSLAQIDLVELNEAFAAQALACVRLLGLDLERVNVRGGAIALGHPLGATGARMVTTLVNALIDRDQQFGLATMCIGLGQGMAAIIERL